ncbi:MAG TPA: ABC transporter substrate-binding protein [Iamia sp.]|nr:ABC transporter substrate-binding protein [Iamia sp.]
MRTHGTRRLVICVAAVALLGAACGGDGDGGDGDAAGPGGGSTLVIGTDAEPTTLDIQTTADNGRDLATWSINEALVDLDAEGERDPVLAAALPEVHEDDPTRWRVELREGIEFSDGTPFDAEAVKYNVERILDPDLASARAEELGTLESVEIVDEHTVDLVTSAPDPILDYRLRVLRMVSPAAGDAEDYSANPVGTGPYVFDSWERGQRVTIQANEDYWGDPKPTIDTIEIRFLPDVNTRISALESGEIGLAINIPPAQAEGMDLLTGSGSTETGMLVYDTGEFPYSEPEFRQALQYAIDLETVNETLYGGRYAMNGCQPVVSTSAGFNDELEPYPYDPEKARELIAGLDLPSDFTLNFHGTAAVYPNDRELTNALVSFWNEVGIEVEITVDEIDPHLDFIYGLQEQTGVTFLWADQSLNHAARFLDIFVTEDAAIPTRAEGVHPEMDELAETATSSLDEDEREAAFDEIWQGYCDDLIMGYTLELTDIAGLSVPLEYEPPVGKLEQVHFDLMRLGDA